MTLRLTFLLTLLLCPTILAKSRIAFRTEVSGESVSQFIGALQQIDKFDGVNVVEIDTPGGSVFAGFEMAKAIESTRHPVVCIVDGMAASMGLYILQSCDIRIMTERSLLMGHEPGTQVSGNRGSIIREVEFLTRLNWAMAAHITHRMSISIDKYLSLIANGGELWLTYPEALAIKAIDFKVESLQEALEIINKD